jgi:DNA-binding NtrC family response regulator
VARGIQRAINDTTAPGDPVSDDIGGLDGECPALVIAWSAAQPHRVGEIAFFPRVNETLYVGRGDQEPHTRAAFFPQRPGGHLASVPLDGKSLSRKQIAVRTNGVALHFEHLGRIPTLVKGKEAKTGTLMPGDTVLFPGELLLLCVSRRREMPPLRLFPETRLRPFGRPDAFGILGESPAAWRLREDLATAAKANGDVLVLGESGAGKGLAAEAIHRLSKRAHHARVSRDATTFPVTLVDAELFGTAKDFPNKGMDARPGLFAEADKGTLYLDEIGDLLPEVQTHLLRVLDRGGEFQRLGERRVRRADVRLVGATRRDPSTLRDGLLARFRAQVRVPPLRERREDIPLLVRHLILEDAEQSPEVAGRFVERREHGQRVVRVEARLVELLLGLPLPTNVRELGKLLWEAAATSPGNVVKVPTALELAVSKHGRRWEGAVSTAPMRTKAEGDYTPEEVLACLERERWRMAPAAKALGLKNRFALLRLIKKMGIRSGAEKR